MKIYIVQKKTWYDFNQIPGSEYRISINVEAHTSKSEAEERVKALNDFAKEEEFTIEELDVVIDDAQ